MFDIKIIHKMRHWLWSGYSAYNLLNKGYTFNYLSIKIKYKSARNNFNIYAK